MKYKKLTKITSKQVPHILASEKSLVATNGFVLAKVPFEQSGETKLDGCYKRAYFAEEIDTVHNGEILLKNELLLEPMAQSELKFPEYDKMMDIPKSARRVSLNLGHLQRLIDVFKEQKIKDVNFYIAEDITKAVHLKGNGVHGLIMPLSAPVDESEE